MTTTPRSRTTRPGSLPRLGVVAGALIPAALLAAVLLLAWSWGPAPAAPAAPTALTEPAAPVAPAGRAAPTGPSDPVAVPAQPATRADSSFVSEPPVLSRLPSGTTVPIRAVGTAPDGRLDVPDDVRAAGWWRGGARLGDPFGSTLVAGHLDSRTQGLGPYAELLEVRPRQRILLSSATLEQEFEVTSLRLVPQESLADEDWIHGTGGPRRLTLVTCSPPYDARRGGYQQLAVVVARPLGDPVRRTS